MGPTDPRTGARAPGATAARLAAMRAEVRRLEGGGGGHRRRLRLDLEGADQILPAGGLPLGCVHEIAAADLADQGAAVGLTAGLAAALVRPAAGADPRTAHGTAPEAVSVLWLARPAARGPRPYPPGLRGYGLAPGMLVFARPGDRRAAWAALEEAARCPGLAAVVAEVDPPDLVAGRRLQLAAEGSGVTVFLLLPPGGARGTGAAVTRWRVAAAPGDGVRPCWRLALTRCRGGRPADWLAEWCDGRLTGVRDAAAADPPPDRPRAPATVIALSAPGATPSDRAPPPIPRRVAGRG